MFSIQTSYAIAIPLYLTLNTPMWAKPSEPTSALAYQQTTNTRIVVEENHLRFFTGSEERVTMDGSGNVGIGISQPTNRLSIKSDAIGEDILNAFNSDGNEIFEIGTLAGNESYLQVNDKDGNVGMQYRSDSHLFQINDLRIAENYSTTSETAWIHYNTGTDRQLGLLLTNDQRTKAEIKLWEGNSHNPYISFSTSPGSSNNMEERMRIDKYGNIGIGTTDPGNYKLNVNGNMGVSSYADIGLARPSQANQEGLFIKGADGNYNTNFHFATESWSGSHAIFFNAYRTSTQVNGSLAATGNSKFTHNVGSHGGGAGLFHYYGNGGVMQFFISNTSTGADTDIDWGTPKMRIQRDGTIGINTNDPDESYTLHVNGKTYATSFHTSANTYADFVFEDSYRLAPLSEVEQYIEQNHHLPDIPSEAEAKENGVDLQEMQAKLLQKIEELTLYVIEQNKKIESLSTQNEIQQREIEKLKRQ